MTRSETLTCLVVFSALASGLCAAQLPAVAPAPSFTISATNVTMPSSGSVAIAFTLTSVNGFVGSVAVDCIAPTEPAGVKAPFCEDYGPVRAFPLTADGTATGSYEVVAIPPLTYPAARGANPLKHGPGRELGVGRRSDSWPWVAKKEDTSIRASVGRYRCNRADRARHFRVWRPTNADAGSVCIYAERDLRHDSYPYGEYHGDRYGTGGDCDEFQQLAGSRTERLPRRETNADRRLRMDSRVYSASCVQPRMSESASVPLSTVSLGSTGVRVSRICLGMMTYGAKSWREWVLEEDDARPFVKAAVEGWH